MGDCGLRLRKPESQAACAPSPVPAVLERFRRDRNCAVRNSVTTRRRGAGGRCAPVALPLAGPRTEVTLTGLCTPWWRLVPVSSVPRLCRDSIVTALHIKVLIRMRGTRDSAPRDQAWTRHPGGRAYRVRATAAHHPRRDSRHRHRRAPDPHPVQSSQWYAAVIRRTNPVSVMPHSC